MVTVGKYSAVKFFHLILQSEWIHFFQIILKNCALLQKMLDNMGYTLFFTSREFILYMLRF
ncbi:MAG: hypothetical protein A2096_07400 [Spirochaetes bacterium GWF1_41_5]|nr:MAG: hypothetical protein A2096_07400 [Spirochaetes bacterium GWF1_41_5]